MPYLQLALELARGTRLALAGDLAGIDAIVADEFADLAGAGDFRLGSGYLAILQAHAARLRGQSDAALRTSLGACAVLATSRVYAGLAHAERAQAAALRGDAAQAAEAMAEADRTHAPGMAVLYPWLEQARGAVLAAGGRPAGRRQAPRRAGRPAARGRLRRARAARPARPGPARPGRRAGRADLHRRRPAHRRAAPGRALRAGRRGAAAAAGPARPGRRRPTADDLLAVADDFAALGPDRVRGGGDRAGAVSGCAGGARPPPAPAGERLADAARPLRPDPHAGAAAGPRRR